MNKHRFGWLAATFVLSGLPIAAVAQEAAPPPSQDAQPAQNAPAYTQAQLDQMVAPVALYPDPLLGQILMASTYPLEVVEAQRWLQDPQNAGLKGDQLAAALEQQTWDPSVKSLVPFPQVLQMMDKNLQWTEQLGDAFLAQQSAVMDAVQQLRQQAQAAGTLKSTPQQVVTTQAQDILIYPVNPQTVYVPYYDPETVYGDWPYADYPPYVFPAPYGFAYDGAIIGFGIGIGIIGPFWGWDHWDWRAHRINIDNDRFSRINNGHPPIASGQWQHDPAHRHGVPYHSAAVRAQFQHASDTARRTYRGYTAPAAAPAEHAAVEHGAMEHGAVTAGASPHMQEGRTTRTTAAAPVREHAAAPAAVSHHVAPAAAERPAPPLFESFSHGADASAHAARGASSRAAAAPARAAAAPARASGGGHGGDDKHR